ncbi:zinc finger protein 512B [Biomphalaria glabrata]|nr:zinc finger protein 512B-like [Biomphalaria glabrata]
MCMSGFKPRLWENKLPYMSVCVTRQAILDTLLACRALQVESSIVRKWRGQHGSEKDFLKVVILITDERNLRKPYQNVTIHLVVEAAEAPFLFSSGRGSRSDFSFSSGRGSRSDFSFSSGRGSRSDFSFSSGRGSRSDFSFSSGRGSRSDFSFSSLERLGLIPWGKKMNSFGII